MKIEILKERENKPLARKEIDFRVDHAGAGTPSRADIRAKISAQFDADKESVIIKSLDTKFGAGITNGTARIYSEINHKILKLGKGKESAVSSHLNTD